MIQDSTLEIAKNAYGNAAFIPNGDHYPARWANDAAAFRAAHQAQRLDRPYGDHPDEAYDLFLPKGSPKGLFIFIHGGFWQAFGRKDWSHFAAGAVARGWVCALPSYTLAPKTTITGITQQMMRAVRTICAEYPLLPVTVAGHSAGGHLTARMGCADISVPEIRRLVPISPLSILHPLMHTPLNDKLHIDLDEAQRESPALFPKPDSDTHIWVGGDERPSFLWQAKLLSENWKCRWSVDEGKHHFNVIDALKDPHSPLTRACLDGI